MSSTEFVHTAEFFQTIFCFSLLVLIGQKVVIIWKKLDEKYLNKRVKLFNEQQSWQDNKNLGQQSLKRQQEHNNQQQQRQKSFQQKAIPPKEQNLRTSLIGDELNQTQRKINQKVKNTQDNQQITMKEESIQKTQSIKRKSLTDLRRQQLSNQKQIQIKDESDGVSSRKQSIDSQKKVQNLNIPQTHKQKKSSEMSRPQFLDLNSQQPSITSDYQNPDGEMREELKQKFKLQIFTNIEGIFNQHLPILMPIIILGIIVHSTYIFTIVCFFGYIFTHLLFNYTGLQVLIKMGKITPLLWIVVIFITYWSDTQFS